MIYYYKKNWYTKELIQRDKKTVYGSARFKPKKKK